MKIKSHTTIDIGPAASTKKVLVSRKQHKCVSAYFAVQAAYQK